MSIPLNQGLQPFSIHLCQNSTCSLVHDLPIIKQSFFRCETPKIKSIGDRSADCIIRAIAVSMFNFCHLLSVIADNAFQHFVEKLGIDKSIQQ